MLTNTDALLDSVLDAMTPGVEMTIDMIHKQHHFDTGYTVSFDAVRSCLERLNHLNAEGRGVRIRETPNPAHRTYMRPIVVGMGATYSIGSDRYPCTVTAISKTGHKITTRDDKATRSDGNGISESQTYTYERDPKGEVRTFYRLSDGTYRNKTVSCRLRLGSRDMYLDPNF